MGDSRLPLHNPVLVIALAMTVFFAAPLLFKRLRLPPTVALIAAGAALGPNGFGWMARDDTIVLLGTVGLLYLMFIAAIEIDLHDFARNRDRSIVFGVLGFLLPLVFGTGVGRLLGYPLAASILLGSMLSSHTLLAYPTASRLGIARNQAVMVAVGATIITDVLALLVLAGIAAAAEGALTLGFWLRFAASLVVFSALVFKALPAFASWYLSRSDSDGVSQYRFILAALFVSAVVAQLAGVEAIIGAFLAGLALNALLPESQPLANRLTFVTDAIFTPFFLLSVGMLVDLRALAAGGRTTMVMLGMVGTVLPAKWLAAWLTRWRFGYTSDEAWSMFGLSVPQAAATLAIALIGYRLKLFDTPALNATIIVILITSTLGPSLVQKHGRRVAASDQLRPYRPSSAPQRILIPVLNRTSGELLVDFSLLLRTPGSKEPLLPISVVSGTWRKVASRVAAAEKMLSHAVLYATGAGVAAVPLTRVARGFASGVGRGITESRATTVVIGWDGYRSRRTAVLNDELDELIAQTQQLVIVSRLVGAVSTVRRVFFVIPPAQHGSPGFDDAVLVVKRIASRLSADLHVCLVGVHAQPCEADVRRVRPRVRESFEQLADWPALTGWLQSTVDAHDLPVLLSERRGLVGWERELDRMPRRLSNFARNFCILYPSALESIDVDDDHVLTLLTEAQRADRITATLRPTSMEAAIEEMLRAEFAEESACLREAVVSVSRSLAEGSAEIAPGAILLGGHVEEVAVPLLFLSTSAAGVEIPHSSRQAHVVAIIVAPSGHPKTMKAYADELGPLMREPGRVDRLAACATADCVATLMRSDPSDHARVRAA